MRTNLFTISVVVVGSFVILLTAARLMTG